jgi:type IV secretion system protein VirB10
VNLLGLLKFRQRAASEEVADAPADSQPEAQKPESSADFDNVAGERGIPALDRTRSLQSRMTSALAIGLMSALALGFLAWYYTQTFAKRAEAQEEAKTSTRTKAQGEMSLPPLGRIDPPTVERVLGPAPTLPDETTSRSLMQPAYASSPTPEPGSYAPSTRKSPAQTDLDRRLSGPVFLAASTRTEGAPAQLYASESGSERPSVSSAVPTAGPSAPDSVAALLEPSATPAAQAKLLPTQRLLLSKGSFLDCTLETAIDSTLPGMTTCVTATDTFSTDGSVVLLERGTKLVGETRGQVRQGSTRVFVLWTEARTPTGVVVPLASPGTDELGRSGLQGEVNRHFWERFGAAILVSVIDGAVQAAAQRSGDGGTVIYSPSTSSDVLTEVLRSTINIPPTVTKQNGDRIAVLVARDLDFRPVYELHPVAENR